MRFGKCMGTQGGQGRCIDEVWDVYGVNGGRLYEVWKVYGDPKGS